jgi:hypothetical protein
LEKKKKKTEKRGSIFCRGKLGRIGSDEQQTNPSPVRPPPSPLGSPPPRPAAPASSRFRPSFHDSASSDDGSRRPHGPQVRTRTATVVVSFFLSCSSPCATSTIQVNCSKLLLRYLGKDQAFYPDPLVPCATESIYFILLVLNWDLWLKWTKQNWTKGHFHSSVSSDLLVQMIRGIYVLQQALFLAYC